MPGFAFWRAFIVGTIANYLALALLVYKADKVSSWGQVFMSWETIVLATFLGLVWGYVGVLHDREHNEKNKQ